MHIGMIGGIGPAATEFYYHHLVKKHQAANKVLDITIVHALASDAIANINSGSPEKQAALFQKLAQRLERAGADRIVISSIAGHFCATEFEKISPLPIINIIPTLEAEFTRRKLKRVGVLGHRISMETKLFGGMQSTELVIPPSKELDIIHEEYVKMATTATLYPNQRELFFSAGRNLCEQQGAEAVVLAGTDLFLAFDGQDCGFEIIDSALVHIDAICALSPISSA